MKILTFTHVFPRSAEDSVAPFLLNYHQALAQQGVETVVLAPHNRGLKTYEERDGFRIYRFRYGTDSMERLAYRGQMHELVLKNLMNKFLFLLYCISAFFSLLRVMHREKPDLVHVHWWIPSGILMYMASFFTRIPYVITTHGTDVFILKRFSFLKFPAARVFSRAARIHVISTYVKQRVLAFCPKTTARIDTIPMPIREDVYPDRVPQFITGTRLLSIGRLIERKGFAHLIEAAGQLPSEYKLTIVGTGPLEETLNQMIAEKNLQEQVRIVSPVSPAELGQIFSEHEIFILPSITDWKGEKEGLGMVLLEAQRYGLALIASRSGGMTDIVVHKKTGFLVPEGDARALAEAIMKCRDKKIFSAITEGAKEHYRKNYSAEAIGRRAYRSYKKALTPQP
ncbi:MAG: glycosyltransferase [Fibrobacterota bacterium]